MTPSISYAIQRMRQRLMPKSALVIGPADEAAVCCQCLAFILAGEMRATINKSTHCAACWTVRA